jgi:hypothetical protein
MTHYLTLPDQATWEAFGWATDGKYAYGPNGQFADIIGDNYFLHEDGTREPRAGYLVNIAGPLPEEMQQYAFEGVPERPKRVFL